jgi:hypothetical protein
MKFRREKLVLLLSTAEWGLLHMKIRRDTTGFVAE